MNFWEFLNENMGWVTLICLIGKLIVGSGNLHEAIEFVQKRSPSIVGEERLVAEGIVLKPKVELFARNGDRVTTKVKTKDFQV